jgi:hypothetical protein
MIGQLAANKYVFDLTFTFSVLLVNAEHTDCCFRASDSNEQMKLATRRFVRTYKKLKRSRLPPDSDFISRYPRHLYGTTLVTLNWNHTSALLG